MRYRITHIMNTDVETFWSKIFFDEGYNQALFSGELGFTAYEVRESKTQPDGKVQRTIFAQPPVVLPPAIKKVLGDLSAYTESGVYNPATGHYTVAVTPGAAADKVKTNVDVWVEARGDKQCERIVEVDSQVKIFGLGKVVEKFIEQQMRSTYDAAAVFTNKWIADKGL